MAALRWLLKLFKGQPEVAGVFHAAFVNSVKCIALRCLKGRSVITCLVARRMFLKTQIASVNTRLNPEVSTFKRLNGTTCLWKMHYIINKASVCWVYSCCLCGW